MMEEQTSVQSFPFYLFIFILPLPHLKIFLSLIFTFFKFFQTIFIILMFELKKGWL